MKCPGIKVPAYVGKSSHARSLLSVVGLAGDTRAQFHPDNFLRATTCSRAGKGKITTKYPSSSSKARRTKTIRLNSAIENSKLVERTVIRREAVRDQARARGYGMHTVRVFTVTDGGFAGCQ
jgi:hypothetical protein